MISLALWHCSNLVLASLSLSLPTTPRAIQDSYDIINIPLLKNNDSSVYEYPDAIPLCTRTDSPSCSARREWNNYGDNPVTQKDWRVLTREANEQLLDDAIQKGKVLKAAMDAAVTSRTSRFDTLPGSRQDANFQNHYHVTSDGVRRGVALESVYGNINPEFALAGIQGADGPPLNADQNFEIVTYNANKAVRSYEEGDVEATLEIAANPDAGVIISTYSYAANDLNDPADKAYSSTLTWNAWVKIAGDKAKTLVAQMRHMLNNQETRNVMDLVHFAYYEGVVMPEDSGFRIGPSLLEGHGVWNHDDDLNEAYLALLSTPNVKACVNMVIDRHLVMDNPYITAIYTFPGYNHMDNPISLRVRKPSIIVKYGPVPQDVIDAHAQHPPGTIDTEP